MSANGAGPAHRVVIVGLTEVASLAWTCFVHDSPHEVVAFAADREYVTPGMRLHDLPVVAIEDLPALHPPTECALHIATGWKRMNAARAELAARARVLGYSLVSYVARSAETWPDLSLGDNVMIQQGASIGPFVRIGNNVQIHQRTGIAHHVTIEDDCYVGGAVAVAAKVTIGRGCLLGLRCTIMPGVTLAPGSFIAACAVVTRDTEPDRVYAGSPARARERLSALKLPLVR